MNGRDESGFVVVAILWMLAALAALASAYAVFAVNTAASVYLPQERMRAEQAILAAVELTAYRQLAWPKPARPDQGAFSTRLGVARIDVVYRSESARVDVNAAARDVLAGVFAIAGAKTTAAQFLADRIVAWREAPKEESKRAEAALYRKAGLSYQPVGAPFDNALELALLPTMEPALLARALPLLTVHNGTAKVDPLVADAAVLAALPGMTAKIQSALRATAAGKRPDAAALAALAGPAAEFVSLDPNDNVRADIVVTTPQRRVAAQVVMHITETAAEPYQILFWRDDFDGDYGAN